GDDRHRSGALDSIWKYNDSGTDPGVSWRETNFYDQSWPTGAALFYTGAAVPPAGDREAIPTLFDSGVDDAHKALVPGAADPHYLLTVSAQGTPPPPPIAATVIQNHPASPAKDTTSHQPAGYRAKRTRTAHSTPPRNTQINPLPLVTYFRAALTFQANPPATSLKLRALIDDGAVFYLNGAEVLRLNMPGGPL